jgi:hypothetical protein
VFSLAFGFTCRCVSQGRCKVIVVFEECKVVVRGPTGRKNCVIARLLCFSLLFARLRPSLTNDSVRMSQSVRDRVGIVFTCLGERARACLSIWSSLCFCANRASTRGCKFVLILLFAA